jgi:hypothetical protein
MTVIRFQLHQLLYTAVIFHVRCILICSGFVLVFSLRYRQSLKDALYYWCYRLAGFDSEQSGAFIFAMCLSGVAVKQQKHVVVVVVVLLMALSLVVRSLLGAGIPIMALGLRNRFSIVVMVISRHLHSICLQQI